jgi:hypothetical protein
MLPSASVVASDMLRRVRGAACLWVTPPSQPPTSVLLAQRSAPLREDASNLAHLGERARRSVRSVPLRPSGTMGLERQVERHAEDS